MQQGEGSAGGIVRVNDCAFPAHLSYDVPNHMWYEYLDSGLVRLGMTSVAAALADNRVFAFTPKRVGREVELGRSCATVESSKWVGPARIAFDGIVVEVNEPLIERPSGLVDDPYGFGWMMLVRPAKSDVLADLVTGPAIAEAYGAWMGRNDFRGCASQDNG